MKWNCHTILSHERIVWCGSGEHLFAFRYKSSLLLFFSLCVQARMHEKPRLIEKKVYTKWKTRWMNEKRVHLWSWNVHRGKTLDDLLFNYLLSVYLFVERVKLARRERARERERGGLKWGTRLKGNAASLGRSRYTSGNDPGRDLGLPDREQTRENMKEEAHIVVALSAFIAN